MTSPSSDPGIVSDRSATRIQGCGHADMAGAGDLLLSGSAKALQDAETCFRLWRCKSTAQRGMVIALAATSLHREKDRLASALSLEINKPLEWALSEITFGVDAIDFYGNVARGLCVPRKVLPTSIEALVNMCPRRVVVIDGSDCFAFRRLAGLVALNLVIGNLVVQEHVGAVPLFQSTFEGLWRGSGASVGAYSNVVA